MQKAPMGGNNSDEIPASSLSSVMELGFPEDMAREALIVSNGSVERAIDYLLSK